MSSSTPSLVHAFIERCERGGSQIASHRLVDGVWQGHSWREGREHVERLAAGLLQCGLQPKERVGIVAGTRREWTWCDLAIQWAGGQTVGIYASMPVRKTADMLRDVGAQRVFVDEAADADGLRAQGFEVHPMGQLEPLEAQGAERLRARPEEMLQRASELGPDDVATVVFTTGSTGRPRKVPVTHRQLLYVIEATSSVVPYAGARALAFLPLAHVFQRYASYLGLVTDVEAYYARGLDTVREDLLAARPSCFALVPRYLEKIHDDAMRKLSARPAPFRRGFAALRKGGERGWAEPLLGATFGRLVARAVKRALGGRLAFIGSGGAPLDLEVEAFFDAIGVPIVQGWGLTETTAPLTLNTLGARKLGSVGRALPGTELKTSPGGELLARGPGVFSGYEGAASATQAAFDAEGWFRTGDLGRIDDDGFVFIHGRKKHIIVTAGGSKVAPMPLEAALGRSPLVEHALVVGDGRPYVGALLQLSETGRSTLRAHTGLGSSASDPELLAHPSAQGTLRAMLVRVNEGAPAYAQVRRLAGMEVAATEAEGTLTPKRELARAAALSANLEAVERLYRS